MFSFNPFKQVSFSKLQHCQCFSKHVWDYLDLKRLIPYVGYWKLNFSTDSAFHFSQVHSVDNK